MKNTHYYMALEYTDDAHRGTACNKPLSLSRALSYTPKFGGQISMIAE